MDKEFIVTVASIVLVIALIIGGGITLTIYLDERSCNAKTEGLAIAHTWDKWGGCRVKDPKAGWVPLENYRVM